MTEPEYKTSVATITSGIRADSDNGEDHATTTDIGGILDSPCWRHSRQVHVAGVSLAAHWLVAAAAFTAPVALVDPYAELRKSGASSVLVSAGPFRWHRISLADAWRVALEVLAEADRALRADRDADAVVFLDFWDEEPLAR